MGRNRNGIATETIVELYNKLGSVWKVAEVLHCNGQFVHKRLKKIGANHKMHILTTAEN